MGERRVERRRGRRKRRRRRGRNGRVTWLRGCHCRLQSMQTDVKDPE